MNKVFMVIGILLMAYLGYKAVTVKKVCLEALAKNILTCEPFKCELAKHPYARVRDVAQIYGYNKQGQCAYSVNTGYIRTTCRFPKNLLPTLAKELDQKARAEKYGPIKKTRMGVRIDSVTGKRITFPEVFLQGKWEAYHHTLRDSLETGICTAVDTRTNKKVR